MKHSYIVSVQWLIRHPVLSKCARPAHMLKVSTSRLCMTYSKLTCRADNAIRTSGWCRLRKRHRSSYRCSCWAQSFVRRPERSDSLLHVFIRSADVALIFSSDTGSLCWYILMRCNVLPVPSVCRVYTVSSVNTSAFDYRSLIAENILPCQNETYLGSSIGLKITTSYSVRQRPLPSVSLLDSIPLLAINSEPVP
jgi:hypothetical protein